MPRTLRISLLLLLLGCCACAGAASPSTPPGAMAAGEAVPRAAVGAVASAEEAATAVGLDLLRSGGNAADAAVAVALALAVVQPQAGNLGGGGFAVARFADETTALDFRETAPAAATPGMFLAADGTPVPEASLVGPLAAGVPGSMDGLFELHRRFGHLPWMRVVEPAATLARDGFQVSPRLQHAIEEERSNLARFPAAAALWLPGGEPIKAGTLLRLPALAATLDAYASGGPRALTQGPVATALEAASRAYGGVLTAADVATYHAVWRQALRFRALGWEIAAMPLPSSGGLIMGESLLVLERLGWAGLPRGGTARAHLLVEAWRRAYADRYLLGDPASSRADAAQLLAASWIAARASGIDPRRATPSDEVRPWPGDQAAPAGGGETTHLSVADATGGAVALTTTLNGWFGCGVWVPEAGFFLNNEMDDFATAPGRPNMFDLVQGEANAVRAGARMLSSMSPTIAWRGADTIVLGSPGGSRIPTATTQVLLDMIVDGDDPQTAVTRPRFHHQWQPDEIRYEAGAFDDAVRAGLEARGHHLRQVPGPLGEVHVVRRDPDGRFTTGADPRGPGAAGIAMRGGPAAAGGVR